MSKIVSGLMMTIAASSLVWADPAAEAPPVVPVQPSPAAAATEVAPAAPPAPVPAPRGMRFLSWLSYFRSGPGEHDLARARPALDDLSIFALQFGPGHAITPAGPWVSQVLTRLKAGATPPPPLWLTVVNDVRAGRQTLLKDPRVVHEKLTTPEARAAHIQELLPWAQNVDGLDIDYEQVSRTDGEAFSLFIEDLAQQLHAQGKKLSVTVEPKTESGAGNGAKALDWKRIGAAADQVRVMAYFYHSPGGSPGPIAPLAWLTQIAQYARSQVPVEKLTVVLTVNGIDWPKGQRGRPIRFHTVASLIAYENARPQRDPVDQCPVLHYGSGKDKHEVWYEDAASLQAKVQRLRQDGIQSIGFWMLGAGDPTFWGRLGNLKK